MFEAHAQHQNPVPAFHADDDEHHSFAFVNLAILQPQGTELDRAGVLGVNHVAYPCASIGDLQIRRLSRRRKASAASRSANFDNSSVFRVPEHQPRRVHQCADQRHAPMPQVKLNLHPLQPPHPAIQVADAACRLPALGARGTSRQA